MGQIIINGIVVLKDGYTDDYVLINDGIFEGFTKQILEGYEIIDAKGAYVIPGLVDIHGHGRASYDTMNATKEALEGISIANLKTGVTSYLPTTMTQSIEATRAALEAVKAYQGHELGAQILGVHMEGPFINADKKGAQPGEFVLEPSVATYKEMTGECEDIVKLITIAPEKPGAYDLVHYLKKQHVTVSMGHTSATYEDVLEATKHGVNHATHTYNAMNPFTHRAPGTVGGIFACDDVYAELILDGIHVHFGAAMTLLKEKGLDHVCLISDAMEAAGLEDGQYQLGGQAVYVKNNEARLIDGTLAGSVLALNKAVYHAVEQLGLDLYQAVRLASYNPCQSIEVYDRGEIAPGKKADFFFADDDMNVLKVFIDGKERD